MKKLREQGLVHSVPRSQKHRYFFFLGDRRKVKEMRGNLLFPVFPYPKGDNIRYDASYQPHTQGVLF